MVKMYHLNLSLGDYYIVYYLDRSGNTLTFTQQNLSVSLEDVAN